MNQRSHAFSADEAPTTPARRGALRELAARAATEDEVPTTLRRSGTVRASTRVTPPVPPPRPTIRSLASLLEPTEVEPRVVVASRPALVPPDPEAFRAPCTSPRRSSDSTRWLVRIALVTVVLLEELLLAAPAGALRPPRDVSDAATMVGSAIRASIAAALR